MSGKKLQLDGAQKPEREKQQSTIPLILPPPPSPLFSTLSALNYFCSSLQLLWRHAALHKGPSCQLPTLEATRLYWDTAHKDGQGKQVWSPILREDSGGKSSWKGTS